VKLAVFTSDPCYVFGVAGFDLGTVLEEVFSLKWICLIGIVVSREERK
jgi:hypothetical protein